MGKDVVSAGSVSAGSVSAGVVRAGVVRAEAVEEVEREDDDKSKSCLTRPAGRSDARRFKASGDPFYSTPPHRSIRSRGFVE